MRVKIFELAGAIGDNSTKLAQKSELTQALQLDLQKQADIIKQRELEIEGLMVCRSSCCIGIYYVGLGKTPGPAPSDFSKRKGFECPN